MQQQYIIICGTPNEGFYYIGPFATRDEAQQHAAINCIQPEWWLSEILPPDEPT